MLRALAVTAFIIAGSCTTAMNWRFSYQLGTTVWDAYIWAVFSVALDVTKWVMLAFVAKSWPTHKARALAAVTIWSVATVYSFAAAIGFAALNRDVSVAARQQQVELHKTIQTMQRSPRWQTTAACADATSPKSQQFCSAYLAAREKLTTIAVDPDPQAQLLAKLTGLGVETARLVLSVFLAIACEVISALGLYAILPVAKRACPMQPATTPKAWSPPPWRQMPRRDAARQVATHRDTARPNAT